MVCRQHGTPDVGDLASAEEEGLSMLPLLDMSAYSRQLKLPLYYVCTVCSLTR